MAIAESVGVDRILFISSFGQYEECEVTYGKMKYSIDFSIFDSPTHAYGNVTGELEFSAIPQLGAEVKLLDNLALKVTSVSCVQGIKGHLLVGLEDVVCCSQPTAEHIGKRLENELGLFCAAYDEF